MDLTLKIRYCEYLIDEMSDDMGICYKSSHKSREDFLKAHNLEDAGEFHALKEVKIPLEGELRTADICEREIEKIRVYDRAVPGRKGVIIDPVYYWKESQSIAIFIEERNEWVCFREYGRRDEWKVHDLDLDGPYSITKSLELMINEHLKSEKKI